MTRLTLPDGGRLDYGHGTTGRRDLDRPKAAPGAVTGPDDVAGVDSTVAVSPQYSG